MSQYAYERGLGTGFMAYPKAVKIMLSKTSGWQPATERVARGGTIRASVINSRLPERKYMRKMLSVTRSVTKMADSVAVVVILQYLKRWTVVWSN